MTAPSSPPCPKCGQESLTPHLSTCPERVERRRYLVSLTAEHRRWHNRDKVCGRVYRSSFGRRRCRGKATLWLVGPRGGITGQWCDQHEDMGYRMFQAEHRTSTLRDADYNDRSSDEEVAMWAIGRGPVVRPWYGPASRGSQGSAARQPGKA